MRASGTDASGANYFSQLLTANGSSVAGERVSSATSGTLTQITNEPNGIVAYFHRPFEAVITMLSSQTATSLNDIRFRSVGAAHRLSTSYDGFTLIPASGTITGTAEIYGLAK